MWREVWDLGHIILFAGLAWAVGRWEARWPPLRRLAIAVVLAAAVGLAVEVLQRFIGRQFSLLDVGYDVLGALIGVTAASWHQLRGRPRPLLVLMCAGMAVLVALITAPVAATALDTLRARAEFPVLAGFHSQLERGRFHAVGDTRLEIGDGRMVVALTTARYSGFFLSDAPRDWRGYRSLVVDLVNPEPEVLPLSCRIHDQEHLSSYRSTDRYNERFTLAPGSTRLEIPLDEVAAAPLGRAMAMDRIQEFGCFVHRSERPRRLIVRGIRLE